MSTNGDELQDQKEQADAALEKAKQVQQRGRGLAEQWRRSRTDNNFRAMVKGLVARSE
jgi:hypothetical protein